jgi:predicted HicB family RNase H-like nuclease
MAEPKRIVIKVSDELHREVREKALRDGINVSQLIRNWLTEWIGKEEKEEKES